MRTALVTGSTGFIGTRLVRKLTEAGTHVVALDILPPREKRAGVDYRLLDVAVALDPAIGTGVDVIYNLAAVHRTPGHPPQDYYRTNILGALNTPGRGLRTRGGGNYTFLANALRRRMFAYPDRKDTIKSGYVDELLDTFTLAMAAAAADSERFCYNFAFPTPTTTEDIVNTFGLVAGLPPPLGVVRLPLLMTAALVFEAAAALGIKNPIHRDRVKKRVNSTAVTPRWLLDNGYWPTGGAFPSRPAQERARSDFQRAW